REEPTAARVHSHLRRAPAHPPALPPFKRWQSHCEDECNRVSLADLHCAPGQWRAAGGPCGVLPPLRRFRQGGPLLRRSRARWRPGLPRHPAAAALRAGGRRRDLSASIRPVCGPFPSCVAKRNWQWTCPVCGLIGDQCLLHHQALCFRWFHDGRKEWLSLSEVLTSSTQHNGAGGAGGDGKSPTGGGGTGGGSAHAGVEGTGGGTTGTGGGKMEVPGHGGGNEGQGVPERREVALDTHRAVPQAGPEVGRRGAGAAEARHTHLADLSRCRWYVTFGFHAMVTYLREFKRGCESPLTGPAWVEGLQALWGGATPPEADV
ncbi:unnamed protein product, partial [Symbiodinium microadriaticum]